MNVRVFDDLETASRAVAGRIGDIAASAVAETGRFTLALAGGRTPRRLYEVLAAGEADVPVDWRRTHVFWGDERCVPPDRPASNYRMARETLLDHVPVPGDQVHRIEGERPPDEAAAACAAVLTDVMGAPQPGAVGHDLVLLGVGADGHTASIFPHSPMEVEGWCMHTRAPGGSGVRDRVTLTLAALNAARHALFLVSGRDKADAVGAALDGSSPAGHVQATRTTEWFLDRAASGVR